MILVTFALPFESSRFRRTASARDVRIIHTGIGREAARAAVSAAIKENGPSLVISSGFAGGLDPALSIGEMVVEAADGLEFRSGIFATADDVLATAQAKSEFRERTTADAVDMESDGIRDVCDVAGVPLVIARAISDASNEDLGVPPKLLRQLAENPLPAVPELGGILLTSSERRRAFFLMLRNAGIAQRTLAEGLPRLIALLEKRGPRVG